MNTQHNRFTQASPLVAALVDFRAGFFRCLTGWADAAFELCDAALCAPAPVSSVPTLSLEPAFGRSHGSLDKALSLGRIDHEVMRDLLVAHRPTTWPAVFAVDASTWARCDGQTTPSGASTTRRPNTRPASHRRRLVLPVDHPARLGLRLLDRAGRRRAGPAHLRHHDGHHRTDRPVRGALTRRWPVADVRLRHRLRPDRDRRRTNRHRGAGPGAHPRRPRLLHRPQPAPPPRSEDHAVTAPGSPCPAQPARPCPLPAPKKHPTSTSNRPPSSQESRMTPRPRFNRKLRSCSKTG